MMIFSKFSCDLLENVYANKFSLFWWLEIPLPNEQARLDIMKIHASPITKHGDIGQ